MDPTDEELLKRARKLARIRQIILQVGGAQRVFDLPRAGGESITARSDTSASSSTKRQSKSARRAVRRQKEE
jgi:hypothetical protein